jgi:hypothetical protein
MHTGQRRAAPAQMKNHPIQAYSFPKLPDFMVDF